MFVWGKTCKTIPQSRPRYGRLGAWLDFFLTGVKETADQAASAARRIVALFEEHQRQIEMLGGPAASTLRVFAHMQRNPIVWHLRPNRGEGAGAYIALGNFT